MSQHVLRLDPKSLEAPVDANAMWARDASTHAGVSGGTNSELASVKAELAALRAQVRFGYVSERTDGRHLIACILVDSMPFTSFPANAADWNTERAAAHRCAIPAAVARPQRGLMTCHHCLHYQAAGCCLMLLTG